MTAGTSSGQPSVSSSSSRALLEIDIDAGRRTAIGGGNQQAPFTGVKALMLAVLDNGIESYLSPVAGLRTEAECWVASRSHGSPFSFPVICETLGLDPAAVRAALRRWRAANLPAQPLPARRRPNVTRASRIVTRTLA